MKNYKAQRENISIHTLGHEDRQQSTMVGGEHKVVPQFSLLSTIVSTLLIRITSRTSFVILGFYLGARFASATAVGLVLETFYLSELLVAPIVGSISDRVGRRPFLLLAPIVAGVAALCLLLASVLFPHPDAHTLNLSLLLLLLLIFLGRLLEGAASGMNVPATLGYITDATFSSQRLRARIVTAFEIATVGGMVLAIPFGGKISSALDTRGFIVVMALYALILLIIAVGVRESIDPDDRQRAPGTPRAPLLAGIAVIRHRRIYTFLPAWFCVNSLVGAWSGLVMIILAYPLPAADQRHPGQLLYGGFSKLSASLWVGLFALVFLLGMGAWMFALPRMRRTTIMMLGLGGLTMMIVALSLINCMGENLRSLPFADHPFILLLIIVSLLGTLLLSGFTPAALLQMGAVAETMPRRRGAVMGLYSVVLAVGQLLGATMGGFFVDLDGFYGLMIFSCIMGFFSLLSVQYMRSRNDDLIGREMQSMFKLL